MLHMVDKKDYVYNPFTFLLELYHFFIIRYNRYLFNIQIPMQYSSDFTFPPSEDSVKCSCNYPSNLESVQQVPITAGWPEAMWIQSLRKAFTSDRRLGNRTPDP